MRVRTWWCAGLVACGGATAPDAGDTAPEVDTSTPVVDAPPPEPPLGGCGMAPYTLPTEGVGVPLSYERNDALTVSRGLLGLAAQVAGVPGLAQPPYDVEAWNVRMTTRDRGQPVEATGMIVMPVGSDPPDAGWPVALLVHSFAGLAGPCSPSQGSLEEAVEALLIASRGFVVLAPDLIGLDGSTTPWPPHAPQVGEQVAIGAWDFHAAARELLAGDLRQQASLEGPLDDRLVLWGASQGGHGVLFTELYGPYLAPDVEVVAVASGTPPLDLRAIVGQATATWGDASGLAALTLLGMKRWYGVGDLATVFGDEPPTSLASTAETALGMDTPDCALPFDEPPRDVATWFTPGLRDADQTGQWQAVAPFDCFLASNSLPGTPVARLRRTPILTVWGERDEVVDPTLQTGAFDALCEDGWDLRWLGCAEADHAEANLWAIPTTTRFLKDRLAGVAEEGAACVRPDWARCEAQP
ncbi:MAG: hypothetical protein H6732_20185 [Alphaproteobacteria bacterium]|nr:hypothetical protein [Alphaproteobacteria bacterium]